LSKSRKNQAGNQAANQSMRITSLTLKSLRSRIAAGLNTQRLQPGHTAGLVCLLLAYLGIEAYLLVVIGNFGTGMVALPVILIAWFVSRRAGFVMGGVLTLMKLAVLRLLIPQEPAFGQVISAVITIVVLLLLSALTAWARELRND